MLQCLEAGLNVRTNFSQPSIFIDAVRRLLSDGRLSGELLDRRVREVLSVKMRLGLFDNPYTGDGNRADREVGIAGNIDFVDRTLAESFVLLKNGPSQGAASPLLPLDKSKLRRILVTGPLADEYNYMSSRYGPNGHDCITMLRGIREYLEGSGVEVEYEKGCDVVDPEWPLSEIIPAEPSENELRDIRRAVRKAAGCDVVIAVMGEDELRTGESRSRTSLELPGRQRLLLQELHRTGKPIVLVLVGGQPLTVNWEDANLDAIIETWFPSCRGGVVLARTLFGEVNPSGKLTVTFPKSVGQIEYNFPFKKGSHGAQYRLGNNGAGVTRVVGPLYPFGHGLSYTTFDYSDMRISKTGDGLKVSLDITNSGSRAGDEVVQLYMRDCVSSVVTYDSVLRGFERVHLKPGETSRVEFTLDEDAFMILDKNMEWTAENGDFEILVGASSTDIRQRLVISLEFP